MKRYLSILLLFLLTNAFPAAAQNAAVRNAAEIRLALEKLNVLGTVLYVGAHPDDENTGLIAYLAKEKKYRAAYLSITRGDGGQNLIGTEKGSDIGILRTQELLGARSFDGGEQFFTRAIDFGYSKSSKETFEFWGRDKILGDVVWVIRNFRPDVIISRFGTEDGGGNHGHHTAGAMLAVEAFTAAADARRFPEQLEYVKPWKAKRVLLNQSRFGGASPAEGMPSVDIGVYNPLLGQSYNEIAGRGRSMHRSQGFGSLPSSGPQLEYFRLLAGEPMKNDIMEGVDTSWNRLKCGKSVERKITDIIASYRVENPAALIPELLALDAEMTRCGINDPWVLLKQQEVHDLIQDCAGLKIEAFAEDYSASAATSDAPEDLHATATTAININLIQRTGQSLRLRYIGFPQKTLIGYMDPDGKINTQPEDAEMHLTYGWHNGIDVRNYNYSYRARRDVPHNVPQSIRYLVTIRPDYPISQPYWLRKPPEKGSFVVDEQREIGLAENPPSFSVVVVLEIMNDTFAFTVPVRYRWVERDEGEKQRPFEIRPPVTANFKQNVAVFQENSENSERPGNGKEIAVILKSHTRAGNGAVSLKTPDGWRVSPENIPFEFEKRHDEKTVVFNVRPPAGAKTADIRAVVSIGGREYSYSLTEIIYPHIDSRVHFPEASLRMVPLKANTARKKLGYIMGSGDDIPDILKDMGYDVTLLDDDMLTAETLSGFDIIVAGIRVYNTRERIKFAQPALMDFVKNGGTYVVQYNVNTGLQITDIGPYPFRVGRDRIVEEDAELRFLVPSHKLLNTPNVITKDDFEDWVQERGLYFTEQWDERYTPVFAGHDTGEKDLEGSTLYCEYGDGVYIYTSLAFFRQLPAGVPGAFLLFQNMLEAGKP